ncbi:MAG: hypothetical protein RR324_01130 [Cellulosilyticaceae bacterium]
MNKIEWEQIPQDLAGTLWRTPVPGGWLLMMTDDVLTNWGNVMQPSAGYEWRNTLTFMPDPMHVWNTEGVAINPDCGTIKGELDRHDVGTLVLRGQKYKVYLAADVPHELKDPMRGSEVLVVKHKFTLIEM